MNTPESIRTENLAYLNEHGFKPATSLPLPSAAGQPSEETGFAGGTLRSPSEIANRFLCHSAVFAWGSGPNEFESKISQFVDDNSLRSHMTEDEVEIINMPKSAAKEEYSNTVGWRLENMWSLAWLLGLIERPSAIIGQQSDDVTGKLIALILPDFNLTSESLVSQGNPVAADSAIATEDLFYLAHNAVRSGQLGEAESVPAGFDPIGDGGAIHERRHSLTWSLSPGADWDDTDLST